MTSISVKLYIANYGTRLNDEDLCRYLWLGHLADPRQTFARQASSFYLEARRSDGIVTSNYVIAELAALLISPLRVKAPKRIDLITE